MKKTILHITDELSIGGTEILLKNTLPLLPEYDHVVCYLHGDPVLLNAFAGVPVYCLDYTSKKNIFKAISKLRKLLKEHHVAIIHAHLLWSNLIARLAKPKKIKLVCTLHNVMSMDAFQKNSFSLWAEKFTIKKVDALIGVSAFVVKDYLQYVRYKGATHVLYNFIEDDFFNTDNERKLPVEHLKLNCVAVGNLKYQKNYPYLIAAFEGLKGKPVALSVYGGGPETAAIQETIIFKELDVQLMGLHSHMENILPEYDVFIQASRYEGYGIALVEAMAKGLLPVISDIPVHREIAGDQALYFDLNDKNALNDQLQKIVNDKSVIQVRRNGVIERAKQVGSSVTYKNKLKEIYSSL